MNRLTLPPACLPPSLILAVLVCFAPTPCAAAGPNYVTLAWDPPATNAEYVVKYRVYHELLPAGPTNWVETTETYCMLTLTETQPGEVYRFHVTALNASGLESDASTEDVRFTIPPVANLPPSAYTAYASVDENPLGTTPEPRLADLIAFDPAGEPLRYALVNQPLYGTARIPDSAVPICEYTPDPGFDGLDYLIFLAWDGAQQSQTNTVIFIVGGGAVVNDRPQVQATAAPLSVYSAGTITLDLVALDPEDQPLGFLYDTNSLRGQVVSLETNAAAVYYVTNRIVYSAPKDWTGQDVLVYAAKELSPGGESSDGATLTINVKDPAIEPPPFRHTAYSSSGSGALILLQMDAIPVYRIELYSSPNLLDWSLLTTTAENQPLDHFVQTGTAAMNRFFRVRMVRSGS